MARILIPTTAFAVFALAATVGHGALISSPAAAAPNGQAAFEANCAMCHSPKKSGGASIGPHLFGVVGRKAGSLKGFAYSSAMKKANFVWTKEKLEQYISDPQKVVPGNRMPYAGDHNPAQVKAIVNYLATLH